MAEITWLGHACFRIRGREAAVLTDPFRLDSSEASPNFSADIVTVSHQHPDHCALESVRPGFRAITGPGEYEIKDVFISGVATFHDNERGQRHGKNTLYLIEIEELVVCHLGDLGHTLTDEQAEGMGSVDVLIVPIGGEPTIDAAVAAEVIGQIDPAVVIPMQFRTPQRDQHRDPLERFLTQLGLNASEIEPVPRLSVRKSDLGDAMQVVVLAP